MVTIHDFGQTTEGYAVKRYEITDGNLRVSLMDYGATIQFIEYAGTRVVLGYDSVTDYQNNGGYLGATIGRCGNRIADGKFAGYDVGRNENGVTHLHGGMLGYDKQIWSGEAAGENAVRFHLTDTAQSNGYPGDVEVDVTFTVVEDALMIDYTATAGEDTPINLTNHAYFNLNGAGSGDVLATKLKIMAEQYLPVDDKLLPTGIKRQVAGTPFDFHDLKPIGKEIAAPDRQLALGGGYDHNFCLTGEGFRPVAQAVGDQSGIVMTCFTDQPGVQLYTGNCLASSAGFADFGRAAGYGKHEAFCLETQHYPDSVHHAEFPDVWLKAGETFRSRTAYAFSKED